MKVEQILFHGKSDYQEILVFEVSSDLDCTYLEVLTFLLSLCFLVAVTVCSRYCSVTGLLLLLCSCSHQLMGRCLRLMALSS